jgi:hypothetical protein
MMAVSVSARSQTIGLPEFHSGQEFRVQNPDKMVGDIIRIVSVSSSRSATKVYHTVNGVGVKVKTAAEFCLAFPNRVQIKG